MSGGGLVVSPWAQRALFALVGTRKKRSAKSTHVQHGNAATQRARTLAERPRPPDAAMCRQQRGVAVERQRSASGTAVAELGPCAAPPATWARARAFSSAHERPRCGIMIQRRAQERKARFGFATARAARAAHAAARARATSGNASHRETHRQGAAVTQLTASSATTSGEPVSYDRRRRSLTLYRSAAQPHLR
jgi:hypothetical protein